MRSQRRGVSTVGLLQAAAVLTVFLSLLSGLEIPHRNIELLSHFRLQYFVVSILLLIAFAFLRDYVYMVSLAVAAIFNATFILPWYFTESVAAEGATIKLIHANVLSRNTEYERLIDFVAAENPDLIFLQEITAEWLSGTTSLLQEYPYSYTEPRLGNFGIAVFSKIPFDSIRHIDSPPFGYPTIFATVTINDEQLNIVSTHPTIPVGRQSYDARNEQLESVADLVNESSARTVLMGDFNSSIWDARFRQLEKSTGLKNVRQGFGILPSWPTYLPFAMIPIDHAFVSEGISVLNVKTGSSIGSDHLPLIVTVRL